MAGAAKHVRGDAGFAEGKPYNQITGSIVNEVERCIFSVGITANADMNG